MSVFKEIIRFVLDTKMWMPANAAVLYKHLLKRQPCSMAADEQHIIAAVDWLKRAQDSTGNNGVAGRYLLDRGWTESYPETSGYIIPTLVDVGERFDDPDCHTRCKRIADFLAFLKQNYNNKCIAIVAHQAPQLALDVLIKGKSWEQAINEDWRKRKEWQPGWKYIIK